MVDTASCFFPVQVGVTQKLGARSLQHSYSRPILASNMDTGDDCFYFLKGMCAKGPSCTFRHVDAAINAPVCQDWVMGTCLELSCPLKHFQQETPCYWESQPSGCTRSNCDYMHRFPRPFAPACTPATKSDSLASAASSTPPGRSIPNSQAQLKSTSTVHSDSAKPSLAELREARLRAVLGPKKVSKKKEEVRLTSQTGNSSKVQVRDSQNLNRSRPIQEDDAAASKVAPSRKRALPVPKRHDESKMPTREWANLEPPKVSRSKHEQPKGKTQTLVIDNRLTKPESKDMSTRLAPKAQPKTSVWLAQKKATSKTPPKTSALARLGGDRSDEQVTKKSQVLIVDHRKSKASISVHPLLVLFSHFLESHAPISPCQNFPLIPYSSTMEHMVVHRT